MSFLHTRDKSMNECFLVGMGRSIIYILLAQEKERKKECIGDVKNGFRTGEKKLIVMECVCI